MNRIPRGATLRFYGPGDEKLFEVTGQEILDTIARNLDAGESGREASHSWQRIPHPGDVDGRRDDVRLPSCIDAGILGMHGGHRRDAPLRRCGNERPARVAVTPRAECRTGYEDVRTFLLQVAEQRRERLFLMLGEIVVPAGERRNDLDLPELARKPATRTDSPPEARRWSLRLVLSAQASEELVHVVDGLHSVRAPKVSWPI